MNELGLNELGQYIANALTQSGSSYESLQRRLTKSAQRSRRKRKQNQNEQSMYMKPFGCLAEVNTEPKQAVTKTIRRVPPKLGGLVTDLVL